MKKINHPTLRTMLIDLNLSEFELDQAFWSVLHDSPYPLGHDDLPVFENMSLEGRYETMIVSNASAAIGLIGEKFPDARLNICQNKDHTMAKLIPGTGIGVHGVFKGNLKPSNISRAIAIALSQVIEKDEDLRQRMRAIDDIPDEIPSVSDWPVEAVSSSLFCAVNHELRLAGNFGPTEQRAAENIKINPSGPYSLMLYRERYERTFGEKHSDQEENQSEYMTF